MNNTRLCMSIRTSDRVPVGERSRSMSCPRSAADLVRRQSSCSRPTALAARRQPRRSPLSSWSTIRFELGLVASLNRPGGNVTGATFYVGQLASRQLELLRELVPKAAAVGVFVNPNAPANAAPQIRDLQMAAQCTRAAARRPQCRQRGRRRNSLCQSHRRARSMRCSSPQMGSSTTSSVMQSSRLRRAIVFPRCMPIANLSCAGGLIELHELQRADAAASG